MSSLYQDGVENPITYASRQLNEHEHRHGFSELEYLTPARATRHFRIYLYGRQFVARTDHRAL